MRLERACQKTHDNGRIVKDDVVSARSSSTATLALDRRRLLVFGAGGLLAACGGGDGSGSSAPAPVKPPEAPTPTPTNSPIVVSPDSLGVRRFYSADHGANLQPAFQAAIDEAARSGVQKIVNDFGPAKTEMWCPVRTTPTGEGFSPDGIPLVIRKPLHIDFTGMEIQVKGPGGGSRVQSRILNHLGHPWVGGWMYVIGYPGFGRITVENVKAIGDFSGSLTTNRDTNYTDKGFRIQDTDVEEVFMKNVELGCFAGEVYYTGGIGPKYQYLEDCHFHTSGQCAFNGASTGRVVAKNMQAGNAYQAAEMLCGVGNTYIGCRFYDSYSASIFGGPSPSFRNGYPFWYSHWDGNGERPWVEFQDTRFERLNLALGSWMRGKIITTDASVGLSYKIGHLRDIELQIESWCDESNNREALGIDGPSNMTTQLAEGPPGAYLGKPSNIRVEVACHRTEAARAAGRRHAAGVRFYGGLLDASSMMFRVSGEATRSWELHGEAAPGFVAPMVAESGFVPLS